MSHCVFLIQTVVICEQQKHGVPRLDNPLCMLTTHMGYLVCGMWEGSGCCLSWGPASFAASASPLFLFLLLHFSFSSPSPPSPLLLLLLLCFVDDYWQYFLIPLSAQLQPVCVRPHKTAGTVSLSAHRGAKDRVSHFVHLGVVR